MSLGRFAAVHDVNTSESIEGATQVVVNDPAGFLAATAHYLCHSADKRRSRR